jgi:hypothetical protein
MTNLWCLTTNVVGEEEGGDKAPVSWSSPAVRRSEDPMSLEVQTLFFFRK